MELLLAIKNYEDKLNGGEFTEEDIDGIKNELEFEEEKTISQENIGPGADLFVILVGILAIVNVFTIGDKVDKGIDGWIKIAKRIKKLWVKKELVSIDKDGASLLAIEFISNLEVISNLEKLHEFEINLVRLDGMFGDERKEDDLITKPHNYFIQSYLINNDKNYVIGVKSSGEVNLIKCFDAANPYGISEIGIEKGNTTN